MDTKRTTTNRTARKPARAAAPKAQNQPEDAAENAGKTVPASPTKVSKKTEVVALLQSLDGATIDELVAKTGWLPHTARAMLTGLKKAGQALTSEKIDGVRRYRISTDAGVVS